jgi:tRNA/tmRNA/rRNA uracil-C5-methylase (TrmA/RlmC/RlmD family)
MIEQKPSIEGVVTHSSKPRLSLTYPCERAAMISFAPSAEFSDAKVLNVVTRSSARCDQKCRYRRTCRGYLSRKLD